MNYEKPKMSIHLLVDEDVITNSILDSNNPIGGGTDLDYDSSED